jgi:hypothetical protein
MFPLGRLLFGGVVPAKRSASQEPYAAALQFSTMAAGFRKN